MHLFHSIGATPCPRHTDKHERSLSNATASRREDRIASRTLATISQFITAESTNQNGTAAHETVGHVARLQRCIRRSEAFLPFVSEEFQFDIVFTNSHAYTHRRTSVRVQCVPEGIHNQRQFKGERRRYSRFHPQFTFFHNSYALSASNPNFAHVNFLFVLKWNRFRFRFSLSCFL